MIHMIGSVCEVCEVEDLIEGVNERQKESRGLIASAVSAVANVY